MLLALDTTRVLSCSILILTLTSIVFARMLGRTRMRFREPPPAPAVVPIPYIGHAFGLLRRRTQYFSDIGVAWREPIATISLFGTKVYVVGSVRMMPFIQRQPRVFSSRSWFAKFVCALVGCSKASMGKFNANLAGFSEGDALLLEGVRSTKRILNSKIGTNMNVDAATIASKHFQKLDAPNSEFDLLEWARHQTLQVVSESTYGPDNPFWDPKVESAFWDFEKGTLALCMTNFLPKALLSKFIAGLRGREVVVNALNTYLHSRLAYGSPIVNAHFSMFAAQVDQGDIARFECASAIGSFSNTVYTSFWTIFHIFSDAKLLADIRAQVSSIVDTNTSSDGRTVNTIDLRRLRSETIIFSTIEEVSRYRATGVGVRYITEDAVVGEGDGRYNLKKGGWVLIANRALHTDKEQWGNDAGTFVASRFTRKIPHMSFHGFGNGPGACCGKNLALYHIASFMGIIVMKYDITPVGGLWVEPGQDGRDTAAQVAGPLERLMVRMTPRKDAASVRWEYNY